MGQALRIGQLAAATGTKVNTIRFYEDAGLLPRAARTPSGRRIYDEPDFRRLRFIRQARGLGFGLDEIRSLLALTDKPDRDCAEVNAMTEAHINATERKIAQLLDLRDELTRLRSLCDGGDIAHCGVLDALDQSQIGQPTTAGREARKR